MENVIQLCNAYLASLKSLVLIHKHNHWTTENYSMHLLLDRVYESANEDVDSSAEKLIGIYGNEADNTKLQAHLISEFLLKHEDKGLESSLLAEKDFCEFAKEFWDTLEENDGLTLGLENHLQGMSDNCEQRIYLLEKNKKFLVKD